MWYMITLAMAAVAAVVEPQPRTTCPTANDYYSNKGGYYGIAVTYKNDQSMSYWTGVDLPSSNLITTDLKPSDPKSLWNKISSYA